MKSDILFAAKDYFTTRPIKKHIRKMLVGGIPAIATWIILKFIPVNKGSILIGEVFSNFINVQINAIAILISFSIAIITIMVSADNANIRKTNEILSTECKGLNNTGERLSLFQVLLSNITYNVFIEAVYLIILIFCVFLQVFFTESIINALMAICIFFVVHIFHVLLETVGQMYLTFWRN